MEGSGMKRGPAKAKPKPAPIDATDFDREIWSKALLYPLRNPLLFAETEQKKVSRLRRRYWRISERLRDTWEVLRHGMPEAW
jgi:transposase